MANKSEIVEAINEANVGLSSIVSSGTERSATVTGSAATIAAANPDRVAFSFQNTSKTGYVWVREGDTAAVGTGQLVGPGGTFIAETQGLVSVVKDTGSADCYCYGLEY